VAPPQLPHDHQRTSACRGLTRTEVDLAEQTGGGADHKHRRQQGAGAKPLSPEEFQAHFGHLPTDGEG
jgi:hypothetical protein